MEPNPGSLTYDYALGCSAADAFAVYAGRIGEWWDPRYSASPATLEDVTIEPFVGGRVYATHGDVGEDEWGEVTTWDPPRRLVHTFTLAQDSRHPTEVTVDFVDRAEGDGCTVAFTHGGWTVASAGERAKFRDWPVLLDRFAALVDD